MASKNSKRNLKKRKNLEKIIFLLFVLFFVLLAVNSYILLSAPIKEETLVVKFSVGNSLGIDLNSSLLTFGTVFPGSVAYRDINIENRYEFPIIMKVLADKNLASLLYVERRYTVGPRSFLTFPIFLSVPEDYSSGNYTGEVKIQIWKG